MTRLTRSLSSSSACGASRATPNSTTRRRSSHGPHLSVFCARGSAFSLDASTPLHDNGSGQAVIREKSSKCGVHWNRRFRVVGRGPLEPSVPGSKKGRTPSSGAHGKHRLRTDRFDQTIAQFYRRSLKIELLPRSPGRVFDLICQPRCCNSTELPFGF